MKKTILSSLLIFAMATLTVWAIESETVETTLTETVSQVTIVDMNETNETNQSTVKCGSSKCGGDKKAETPAKCGAGKCGSGQ